MPIEAVTFDVGGTLIEVCPSVGHVYAEVAARHGVHTFSPEQLNARFKAAWRARPTFGHLRENWAELVQEVFRESAPCPPGKDFFPDLYERFAQPEVWHVFEDVVPTLKSLASKNIKLGVISNWDERLRGLLGSLKLDRYFQVVVISCEVGFPKPAREIFDLAIAELGVPAASILHIGDSWEADVLGARAAGFQALQIHRKVGATASNDSIHSLAEALPKIEKLFIR